MYVYIHIYVYTYVCMYICVYIYTHVCVYIYTHICIHTYIHTYIYIYIYIYIRLFLLHVATCCHTLPAFPHNSSLVILISSTYEQRSTYDATYAPLTDTNRSTKFPTKDPHMLPALLR